MDLGTRNHLRKLLQRKSPYADTCDSPSEEVMDYLLNQCKILVVGAGGLGCELLKDLALMGVRDIHDIGKSKALVAAQFVERFIPDCKVTAHHNRIQDFDATFYNTYNIIICGLDSLDARRWINNMMVSLVELDEEGHVDQSTVIPLIDGGTEGLKGNARVILPRLTACIECNLDLYPPPINYPLCTIANTPRLPEHTIEYVNVLLWPKIQPFGPGVQLDGDDPDHIDWVHKRSVERAKEFNIEPPSFRFTQGVVKRTIPAVSSTNACIAATCVMEAFKLVTSSAKVMNNYHLLNLASSVYTYVFEAEKNDDCLVCGKTSIQSKSMDIENVDNKTNSNL